MKKEDVLFACTIVMAATAVIGAGCAVLMATHLRKAVRELGRVADNVTQKVDRFRTRRGSAEGL